MATLSNPSQGDFVTVARADDVGEGKMFGVAVAGKPILLCRTGGKIFAMDAVCSHYNSYLPSGEVKTEHPGDGRDGPTHPMVCPVHKAEFEATTGKVLKNVSGLIRMATHKEATDLRTYELEVVDGQVRIRV